MGSLKDNFPRIFALAVNKQGPVANFGHWLRAGSECDTWIFLLKDNCLIVKLKSRIILSSLSMAFSLMRTPQTEFFGNSHLEGSTSANHLDKSLSVISPSFLFKGLYGKFHLLSKWNPSYNCSIGRGSHSELIWWGCRLSPPILTSVCFARLIKKTPLTFLFIAITSTSFHITSPAIGICPLFDLKTCKLCLISGINLRCLLCVYNLRVWLSMLWCGRFGSRTKGSFSTMTTSMLIFALNCSDTIMLGGRRMFGATLLPLFPIFVIILRIFVHPFVFNPLSLT